MGVCKIDGCNEKRVAHGPGMCRHHLNGRKTAIDKIKRASEILDSAPVPTEGRLVPGLNYWPEFDD